MIQGVCSLRIWISISLVPLCEVLIEGAYSEQGTACDN